jgi:hypothetical protein
VEDVPRDDLLDVEPEVDRICQLEGGHERGDRVSVIADLDPDLGLHHNRGVLERPGRAVFDQAVAA